ncbi:MAG: hypothetical protein ACK5NK_00500 [Niabella sp.]
MQLNKTYSLNFFKIYIVTTKLLIKEDEKQAGGIGENLAFSTA